MILLIEYFKKSHITLSPNSCKRVRIYTKTQMIARGIESKLLNQKQFRQILPFPVLEEALQDVCQFFLLNLRAISKLC